MPGLLRLPPAMNWLFVSGKLPVTPVAASYTAAPAPPTPPLLNWIGAHGVVLTAGIFAVLAAVLFAPITERSTLVMAAVNVVEHPPRNATPTMARKYLPLLRDTAKQIEAALHASQHAVVSLTQQPEMPALIG